MSRSGSLAVLLSCAIVMFAAGCMRGRVVLAATVVAAGLVMWVPDAVWSRMTFSMEGAAGAQEARERIFLAAIEYFPEYALAGVGNGNFWDYWGPSHGFCYNLGCATALGAHNAFFQITIDWGSPALLALIALIWRVYRCLPKKCGSDDLALALLGVSASLLVLLLFQHSLYAKDFSLGLGLLVGAGFWIFPHGVALSSRRSAHVSRRT